MNRRNVLWLLATALAASVAVAVAAGPVLADEVHLENGDVLRGKVTGADDKNLTIKHDFGDEIVIPLEKVLWIDTAEETIVRLKDSSQLKGKIKPGPEPRSMNIETADAGTVSNVKMAAVQGFGAAPPDTIYSGRIALGLTIQDGNTQQKSFFGSLDAERRTKQDLLEGHAFYNYGESFGEETNRKGFARIQYNYYVWHPLYAYVGAALEYDKFKDLRLRSRGGVGMGYAWVDTKTMSFRTEAGIEYVNEDYFDDEDKAFVALRGAFTFDWQITEWAKFREFFEIFPNVEKWSDFVIHSETSITFALWKGFGLAGIIIWDHDQVPPEDAERNDVQYILTLTYTF